MTPDRSAALRVVDDDGDGELVELAALATAFSPTGYAPSVVGTRYVLNAS
jgi:hypothetical protein